MLRTIVDNPEHTPADVSVPVAVSRNGDVVYLSGIGKDVRVVRVDSTGRRVAQFGRAGSGPGEFRGPSAFFFRNDDVYVFDFVAARLSQWSRSGQELGTRPVARGLVPLVADSAHGVAARVGAAGIAEIVRWAWDDDRPAEKIIGRESEEFSRIFPEAVPGQPYQRAIVGTNGTVVVVGNATQFAFVEQSLTSRTTRSFTIKSAPSFPSAARVERLIERIAARPRGRLPAPDLTSLRQTLPKMPVPHFAETSPFHLDSKGRLWMVGVQGDSAVLRVVEGGRILSERGLSCPGFEGKWAMRDRWVALICDADGRGDDVAATLQLYSLDAIAGRR